MNETRIELNKSRELAQKKRDEFQEEINRRNEAIKKLEVDPLQKEEVDPLQKEIDQILKSSADYTPTYMEWLSTKVETLDKEIDRLYSIAPE